jgi:flavin-dependent dehydrogenase
LPPGVEPLFTQLGVAEAILAAGFTRHLGTWVSWSGPRRFDPFGADSTGPWQGFQAPRKELDQLLLAAAARSGVTILQPCRGVQPLHDGERVVGIGTAEQSILARWVIDAGGGGHWLARRLAIPLRFASPRLIARYGYLRGSCPERDDAPEIAADDTGWSWSAHIAPGLYHWMRLSLAPDDPLRDRPPVAFAKLTPHSRTRGADVTWRIVARPAGPGYICVGDAAAVLDPASSHGVLKAIMSGMMAGHVIAQAATGSAGEREAIATYTAWISELFNADVNALTRLYGELPHPPPWVRQRLDALSAHDHDEAPSPAAAPGTA